MYQSCYINHPFTTQELRILLHKLPIYNSNNTQEAALASMLLTTHPDKWAEPVLQEVTRNKSSFINNFTQPKSWYRVVGGNGDSTDTSHCIRLCIAGQSLLTEEIVGSADLPPIIVT